MGPSTTLKRRRTEEGMRGKVQKKRKNIKRQKFYHSSSEDESDLDEGTARDAPRKEKIVNAEGDEEARAQKLERKNPSKPEPKENSAPKEKSDTKAKPESKLKSAIKMKKAPSSAGDDSESDEEEDAEVLGLDESDSDEEEVDDYGIDSDGSDLSETSTNNPARKVRKRNDPEAFATSISKILNTKLTTTKRSEPILSRSKAADYANKTLADIRLTRKANKQLLAEKKAAQEMGRVKDVLGLNDPSISTEASTAKEKELRRTAQKGVIKLFNAVRAAQVKGEAAEREAKEKGLVGMAKREEKVKEMSKQGFLDMISGGAKKKEASVEA